MEKKQKRIIKFKTKEGREMTGQWMHSNRQGHFVLLLPSRRTIWAIPNEYVIYDSKNDQQIVPQENKVAQPTLELKESNNG